MDLAKAVETEGTTADEARSKVQARVKQAAARQAPKPTRTKAEREEQKAQRQAAKEAQARRQAERDAYLEQRRRADSFTEPLHRLERNIYAVLAPDQVPPYLLYSTGRPYTLAQMVAAIDDKAAARIPDLLQRARIALEAMEEAWHARLGTTEPVPE